MMTMSMMGVATRRTVEAVRHRSRYLRQTPASRKIQNSASPAMMNSSIGYLAQMCELLLTLSRPTLLMMPRPLFGSRPPLIRLGLDGAARLRMQLRSVSLVRRPAAESEPVGPASAPFPRALDRADDTGREPRKWQPATGLERLP